MWWVIIGAGLPDLRIYADTFDKALEKARRRSEGYCGGYVWED